MTARALVLADWLPRLQAFYGPLPSPPADPFGVFLWEVLGTRTTPGRRDAALMALRRIPAMTPDAIRKIGRGRLESVVRLCGPFVEPRLAALDAGLETFGRRPRLVEALSGSLRQAWPVARDLPHLDEAAALRVLLYGTAHGVVPVDADLSRWAVRMGIVSERWNDRRTRRAVRRRLSTTLPGELSARRQAVSLLSHHARATCIERHPHCGVCPLTPACRYAAP